MRYIVSDRCQMCGCDDSRGVILYDGPSIWDAMWAAAYLAPYGNIECRAIPQD